MSVILNRMMGEMRPAVEKEMKAVLCANGDGSPDALFFQMMHYHMGWVDENLHTVERSGGKRIRPVLNLLCAAAAGGEWRQAVPAAAAIELLHNFTLIHDDIQDASPTRHGRPTLWTLWGIPQAINSGDCMFALSHTALYGLQQHGIDSHTVVRAANRFDDTCLALTLGQHRDMNFETQLNVSANEYMQMIGGKTAALLALCGELGSLVAGADDETVVHYREFCRNLGLAFQIKDDILGIWGDEAAIGKSTATDIETRKKTLPILYGLSRSEQLQTLYHGQENGENFVEQVVALLGDVEALSFAEREAESYSRQALEHLDAAEPIGEAGEALRELADLLLSRQH